MWSLRTSSWKPSGVVSRFVRKVRTASGAVAVQVVTRRGRQVERVEHVRSAHTDAELALLLAAAGERLSPGQGVLDLGDLPVVPARMDEVADWNDSVAGASEATDCWFEEPVAGDRRSWAMPPGHGTYRGLDLELLDATAEGELTFLVERSTPNWKTRCAAMTR
jgi:hypothetical protein